MEVQATSPGSPPPPPPQAFSKTAIANGSKAPELRQARLLQFASNEVRERSSNQGMSLKTSFE